jgi:hypothetical protein
MKILGLDLSTHTGWGCLEDGRVVSFGQITKQPEDFSAPYPANYLACARSIAECVVTVMRENAPTHVVIEETNKSSRFTSRYSQKLLEFIHFAVAEAIVNEKKLPVYLSTSEWRKLNCANLSQDEREYNARVKQERLKLRYELESKVRKSIESRYLPQMTGAGPEAKKFWQKKISKEVKACVDSEMGKVRAVIDGERVGQRTIKHVSVERVNKFYDMKLSLKDNDIAEAILLARGYYLLQKQGREPNDRSSPGHATGTGNERTTKTRSRRRDATSDSGRASEPGHPES